MSGWFETFRAGGILMYPILLCSVIMLTILIERFITLQYNKIFPEDFLFRVKNLLNEKKISEALTLCQSTWKPMSRIMEAGILKHSRPREEIKEAIENAGKQESIFLEKYLSVLATIASICPSLGLLGTVVGMIKVFHVISIQGVGNPTALAGGISEALITTAAGLIVAIPTLVLHNYFRKRANTFLLEMEKTSMEILEILAAKKGPPGSVDTFELRDTF